MMQDKGLVLRPFVRPFVNPFAKICDHLSGDSTVRVCISLVITIVFYMSLKHGPSQAQKSPRWKFYLFIHLFNYFN